MYKHEFKVRLYTCTAKIVEYDIQNRDLKKQAEYDSQVRGRAVGMRRKNVVISLGISLRTVEY